MLGKPISFTARWQSDDLECSNQQARRCNSSLLAQVARLVSDSHELLIEFAFLSDRIKSSLEVSPMRKIKLGFAALVLLSAVAFIHGQSADVPRYQLPPKDVVDAFDAQPLPNAVLSPTKQMLALQYRHPYPTIAELAQPILRIAGARVNPRNNGPQRAA